MTGIPLTVTMLTIACCLSMEVCLHRHARQLGHVQRMREQSLCGLHMIQVCLQVQQACLSAAVPLGHARTR